MPPLVSIIIPCYQQGRFLPGAIDAALGQSYSAVEVIVVNDGSDDQTDEVAGSYGSRIVYVSQMNQGSSVARNTGIAVATGKYLNFLDADDLLHREAIGWLVEAVDGRDDVLGVLGYRLFEKEEGPFDDRLPPDSSVFGESLLIENPSAVHGFLSPRQAVVACGGFDRSLRWCEDWDLWLRLVFAGLKIRGVKQVGAYYRQRPHTMSRNRGRMAQARAEMMYRTLLWTKANPSLVRELGADPLTVSQRLVDIFTTEYLDAGYLLREQGAYREAMTQYWRSFWRGRPSYAALSGLGKLLPHRILRPLRPKR